MPVCEILVQPMNNNVETDSRKLRKINRTVFKRKHGEQQLMLGHDRLCSFLSVS